MISYSAYKVAHITCFVYLMVSVFSICILQMNAMYEGQRRKNLLKLHGFASAFVLVSGFGLLARLGMTHGLPTWIYFKLAAWVFFSMSPALIKKTISPKPVLGSVLFLFPFMAFLAIYKPF